VIVDGVRLVASTQSPPMEKANYGFDHFHLYLMDAKTGEKIGPLEEIKDPLDTRADPFYAKSSADSYEVSTTYRVDRHEAVMVRHRIDNRRAYRLGGPTKVEGLPEN
jgi:hypothetical protein